MKPEQIRIENGVLISPTGQLYLVGGNHIVIDYITGKKAVSPISFQNFSDNITSRSEICAEKNIKFVHVIFPDKHTVLFDDFPIKISCHLGSEYIKHSSYNPSIFYPLQELRNLAEPAYLTVDTHLSVFGEIRLFQKLCNMLYPGELAGIDIELLTKLRIAESYSGDLGSKLEPVLSQRRSYLNCDWNPQRFSNEIKGGNDGICDIVFNKNAKSSHRVLLFGDSFLRSVLLMFSYVFSEVCFLRTRYMHVDMVNLIKPDVVITGNVERYLSFVDSDHNAPVGILYSYLSQPKHTAPEPFTKAFNAVLSYGRPPYYNFLRENIY